jgi:fumarylpyruvate hydrolase
MNYVFPPAAQVVLPVAGSDAVFPVRRVYCVGQNYAAHVAEMGGDGREDPFFFSKPADALVPGGGDIAYPPMTSNLQHEVELVVALGKGGANIAAEQALSCVYGYAVGFDLTRRDLQARAKEKKQPWEMGKGLDQGGPISALVPVGKEPHPLRGSIWLKVNGEMRQSGDLAQMIWSVAEIIAKLSSYVRLAPGDLIFTGTPSGVSTIVAGDRLEGGIDGVGELKIRLVDGRGG